MPCYIYVSKFQTKVGKLTLNYCENGLHEICLSSAGNQESIIHQRPEISKQVFEWLDLYFKNPDNVRNILAPSICPSVFQTKGEFTTKVWHTLMQQVPPGTTISYGQLASLCGSEKASRAVGTAMRTNPLPILIPCHRVIKSDGTVGFYSGGSNIKEWLLRHENVLDDD